MESKLLWEIKKINLLKINHKKNKKFLPSTVFFTDRKKNNNFEKTIASLPKNSAIIIREYDLDTQSRFDFSTKIINIAKKFNHQILVGKDFRLAINIKADGIHFSDIDRKLPIGFLRKKSSNKNFIFSYSCHSFRSFLKSKTIKPDLIFISPIFHSSSHTHSKELSPKIIYKINRYNRRFKNKIDTKIYGLGGINKQNINLIRKSKIDGFGAIDIFSKNS